METEFTPMTSLAGGALIGLAAVLYMATTGRIAGISGILGGLFMRGSNLLRNGAFLLGLILAYPIISELGEPETVKTSSLNFLGLALAGALVGFGTGIGSGCTSGHGVCGISRFSIRSIIATLVFLGVGILTTTVIRQGGL